jgi:hypothetical protein
MQYVSSFPQLRTETDPISETLCFVGIKIPYAGRSPVTVIQSLEVSVERIR